MASTSIDPVITPNENHFLKELEMKPSTLDPINRMRQLMATRNEWKLYKRTCDATGDSILSAYAQDSPYTVYKHSYWWGDQWEALDYGRDVDFSRPFFDQFYDLQLAVPREGTSVFESENCDYNSHTRYSKNCYLNSLVVRAEDIYYSYWMVDVEDIVDCALHIAGKSSLCYQCLDFGTCYNCIGLQECYNCQDSLFSFLLRGCDHCLFCTNLTNKSYHIRNKPVSKKEFEEEKAKYINGSYRSFKSAIEEFKRMKSLAIHRSTFLINCENVTGDHVFDSKNCQFCFDSHAGEDCSVGASIDDSKDIYSCYSSGWPRCEKLYNCAVSRGCTDMAYCRYMWFCSSMRYCDSCQSSSNCLGCTGLRHKNYCILNKQYTKQEYRDVSRKIIDHMKSTGEWGAFWPYHHLPFAYNESAAQDYYPLERQQALDAGYTWRDTPDEPPTADKLIQAAQLPDNISDVPDDILQWAILCEVTGKPFLIIKKELEFYCKMQLPLPRIHPMERHRHRMQQRNPYVLTERRCSSCGQSMHSAYDPSRTEKVYCENCYQRDIL